MLQARSVGGVGNNTAGIALQDGVGGGAHANEPRHHDGVGRIPVMAKTTEDYGFFDALQGKYYCSERENMKI